MNKYKEFDIIEKVLNISEFIFNLIYKNDSKEIIENYELIKDNLELRIFECGTNIKKMEDLIIIIKPYIDICAKKLILIGFNFILSHWLGFKNNCEEIFDYNSTLKQKMINSFVLYQNRFENLLYISRNANEYFKLLLTNHFDNKKLEIFNDIKGRIRSTFPSSPKTKNDIWKNLLQLIINSSQKWNEFNKLSNISKIHKNKKLREINKEIMMLQNKSIEIFNSIFIE